MFSHVAVTKMLVRAGVSTEGSVGEGFNFKLIYMVIGRNKCCCTEGLNYSLTVDQRQPSAPCHVGLFTTAIYFIKSGKREKVSQEVTETITETTSPQHCHILLFRSKLLKGREIHKAMKTWRQGSLGSIIETTDHTWELKKPKKKKRKS